MKQPELKTSKSGTKCLICYYTGDGYDRAILQAEKVLNVEGDREVTVICFPESSKFNDFYKRGRESIFKFSENQ